MSNSRGKGRAKNTVPKKRATAVTITVIVIVLLFIAALIINSSFLRRQMTAVEANGMKFSTAEYRYFYVSTINEYTEYINSSFGDYASSFLPDSSLSFDEQINVMTGQTWTEYYYDSTLEALLFFSGAYQDAEAAGFAVADEEYDTIDAEIDEYFSTLSTYYGMTVNDFLSSQFGSGSGMNEALYRELNKKQYYVSMYSQSINDAFVYSEAEIDEYYEEKKDDYDYFKYRFFTVRAATLNEDDYETTEEYEEADKAALDEARALAAEYVATITNEADFLEKAKEYNADSYSTNSSTLYNVQGSESSTTFDAWLKDPSRQEGDMCTEPTNENESDNRAFYVVYFLERINNEYPSVNINFMLLTGETISSDDYLDDNGEVYEEAYNNAIEDERLALESKAGDLFEEWKAAGGTSEYLSEYYAGTTSIPYGSLDEYTAAVEGAVYNNAGHSYTNDDGVDSWMHDPARKEGDTALIKYLDNMWYLIYFSGQDINYCDHLAETGLRGDDYNAWEESFKTENVKVSSLGMKLL